MAGQASASEITFLRALCAIVVLLPFVAHHGFVLFSKKSVLLWVRSILGALSVLCLVWNLQQTTVGFANTLFNIAPIFVVLLGAMWQQEKLSAARFTNIVLVVIASSLFWHGSRPEVRTINWVVGLGGMCAAAIAYALLKSLPTRWGALDVTWCLNLATLPVALLFKDGPWYLPSGRTGLLLGAICALSVIGNALANLSFRYLELSTATALIPSAIIWGVVLDMTAHTFPAIQGIAGCVLYLVATIRLARRPHVTATPPLSVVPAELTE
jgi:drug/metabolite transporter (DMT)-like permease